MINKDAKEMISIVRRTAGLDLRAPWNSSCNKITGIAEGQEDGIQHEVLYPCESVENATTGTGNRAATNDDQ